MILKKICSAVVLLSAVVSLSAQTRQTREEYVDRYKEIAIKHQEKYGIPASITMAQGILESDSGNSLLSTKSNNHFGIKCKSNWTGRTVTHDDDERGECFRAYRSVEDSYEDHADFLDSNARYDTLFLYQPTDYKRWAFGLKGAGYATAPDYAQRLIKIIEDNKLYLLDQKDGAKLYADRANYSLTDVVEPPVKVESSESEELVDPDNYHTTINAHMGYNVYRCNGVFYVVAKPGDTLEAISDAFNIWKFTLRRFNEMSRGEEPISGERIYINRKPREWSGDESEHKVQSGETLHSISQLYAIRQSDLRRMNDLKRGTHVLEVGSIIKLK